MVLRRGARPGRAWLGRSNGRRLRPSRPADRFLLGVGVACVIGAIVAGSLKVENVELPAVTSPLRQALLGGFGALLIAASLLVRTRDDTAPAATTERPLVPVPGVVPPTTRYFRGRVEPLAELDRLLQAEGLGVTRETRTASSGGRHPRSLPTRRLLHAKPTSRSVVGDDAATSSAISSWMRTS